MFPCYSSHQLKTNLANGTFDISELTPGFLSFSASKFKLGNRMVRRNSIAYGNAALRSTASIQRVFKFIWSRFI